MLDRDQSVVRILISPAFGFVLYLTEAARLARKVQYGGCLARDRFSRFGFLLERTRKGRFGRRILFDDIDGYAIDKYSAVRDAYVHQQAQGEEEVKRGGR